MATDIARHCSLAAPASMAASARELTLNGGRARDRASTSAGRPQPVADPEPGEGPVLGQGALHEQVGPRGEEAQDVRAQFRVAEGPVGLVQHDEAVLVAPGP